MPLHLHQRVLSLLLAAGLVLICPHALADETFVNPTVTGSDGRTYRLDRCLHWETLCECAAAREFCREKGFRALHHFVVDHDVIGRGIHTAIIGDPGVLCPDHAPPHGCDSFSRIECTQNESREDIKQCHGEPRVAALAPRPSTHWTTAKPSHSSTPAAVRDTITPGPITSGGAESVDLTGARPSPAPSSETPPLIPPLAPPPVGDSPPTQGGQNL